MTYSMSFVFSWNDVGDVLCQFSSSPFCMRPFLANAETRTIVDEKDT